MLKGQGNYDQLSGQGHVHSAHEQIDSAVLILVNLIAEHVSREIGSEFHSGKLGDLPYPKF